MSDKETIDLSQTTSDADLDKGPDTAPEVHLALTVTGHLVLDGLRVELTPNELIILTQLIRNNSGPLTSAELDSEGKITDLDYYMGLLASDIKDLVGDLDPIHSDQQSERVGYWLNPALVITDAEGELHAEDVISVPPSEITFNFDLSDFPEELLTEAITSNINADRVELLSEAAAKRKPRSSYLSPPEPLERDPGQEWKLLAQCSGVDTKIFFPTNSEYGQALEFCASCMVRYYCLEAALRQIDSKGMWGGTSERERHRILKARGVDIKAELKKQQEEQDAAFAKLFEVTESDEAAAG